MASEIFYSLIEKAERYGRQKPMARACSLIMRLKGLLVVEGREVNIVDSRCGHCGSSLGAKAVLVRMGFECQCKNCLAYCQTPHKLSYFYLCLSLAALPFIFMFWISEISQSLSLFALILCGSWLVIYLAEFFLLSPVCVTAEEYAVSKKEKNYKILGFILLFFVAWLIVR